ncbi:TetR family transcriptional regulator [Miniimonas sp. S16]|uniref:TetR/AcrR family transcriptional regulator n=1 Tax=Miniimonas sp. S16 TaxID=2171623 RepID=UPI000D525C6E
MHDGEAALEEERSPSASRGGGERSPTGSASRGPGETSRRGSRQGRRNDPGRRDRIVDACLDVIARDGVAGTSHRRVAAEADVPLGAMTYYFDGMGELLHEAFARFATTVSDRFEARMAQARSREEARDAVVALILEDVFTSQRELVLSHELYTLAARDAAYRDLTTAWMARSRAALERHFDPETARMLDALIEGLTIHRALDAQARDAREVELAVGRLTASK